jgi:tetratricopeptide (TPR) repeat protein
MRKWAAWLFGAPALLAPCPNLSAFELSLTPGADQRSEGACSPNILNNQGQISISCPGVDPKALRYLEEHISEQLRDLVQDARTTRNLNERIDELRNEASNWAQRYRELSARLEQSGDDSERAKQAHKLIGAGEFDRAEAILEEMTAKEEDVVASAAAHYYELGTIKSLRFDARGALPQFEKAFRYRPDNPRYAEALAEAAQKERHYGQAEIASNAALKTYRDLAGTDPDAYRPKLAGVLNNLAILYANTGRLAEAKAAYEEALTIGRELAAADPRANRSSLALALNNFGTLLQSDAGRTDEAEKVFGEALAIYRELAVGNPDAYQPSVATVLNNLGNSYSESGRFSEAEKAFSDALAAERDLALRQPELYRPADRGIDVEQPRGAPLANSAAERGGKGLHRCAGDPPRPRQAQSGSLPAG